MPIRPPALRLALAAVLLAGLAFAPGASAASYLVNDTADAPLTNPTDTSCVSSDGGACTLRAAVQAADNAGGASDIVLPAVKFTLSIAPSTSGGSDDPAAGDLDIDKKSSATSFPVITLFGGSATIDAAKISRIFTVAVGASLGLDGVTLQNGAAPYSIPAGAMSDQADGGAIMNHGTLAIADSELVSNAADHEGGAIYSDGPALSIESSTFAANTATIAGGAVTSAGASTVTLTNDTLTDNSSGAGGGIAFLQPVATGSVVDNLTIAGNTSSGDGGGLYFPSFARKIANTIVAGNTGSGGADCANTSSGTALADAADAGGNVDSDGTCFSASPPHDAKTGVDPKLGPLADNGGPSATMALLPGSPAIGQGTAADCPDTDQRGISRPSASCDAGAFQTQDADLALSASGPSSAAAGDLLTETFTVTNHGPGPATGVTVDDALPSGTTGGGASASQGSCAATTQLTCSLGALGAGQSATVTVVFTPTAGGSVTNGATVGGEQRDADPSNNSASVTTSVSGGSTAPTPTPTPTTTTAPTPTPTPTTTTPTTPPTTPPTAVPAPVGVGHTDTTTTGATVPVACSGSSGTTCAVTVTMTVDQHPGAPSLKGSFDPGTANWVLQKGSGVVRFTFGLPGAIPVTGDWTGTGHTGIGIYDPRTSTWYLRNQASAGPPDITFNFGVPGVSAPVTGDWTGSGRTGVGVYLLTSGVWFVRNSATADSPNTSFSFGAPGWTPVTGDWTGAGRTGIGIVDPATATWYLRSETSTGAPDAGTFAFGAPGYTPVTGDWTGSGATGIGVVNPGNGGWFQRVEASTGPPDAGTGVFGLPHAIPVTGDWNFPAGTRAVARAARTSAKAIVVGTASAKIAAHRSRTLKVALNATGRRLLARKHTLRVLLVVKSGGLQVTRRVLTFKAKAKAKAKGKR